MYLFLSEMGFFPSTSFWCEGRTEEEEYLMFLFQNEGRGWDI